MVISPRVLSLCSGYGGLDLGVEFAIGGKPVCYVEREAYAAATLVARMADKTVPQAPIWDDVKTFDGKAWRGAVDCITAGYPCQSFSMAGHCLGESDARHIWPDVRRIVGEVRPRFCFFENVANHLNMGFDTVSRDLQEMGYDVAATLVTAAEVGAPHKRDRLFILANSKGGRCEANSVPCRGKAENPKLIGGGVSVFPPRQDPSDPRWKEWHWPSFKPEFCRGSYGSAKWNDRLRLCGNGVVPLAAAYAFGILSHDLGI